MDRQDRIDAAIAECSECGGYPFPKRSDCDGCTASIDEEIAAEALAVTVEGDRIAAITRDIAVA